MNEQYLNKHVHSNWKIIKEYGLALGEKRKSIISYTIIDPNKTVVADIPDHYDDDENWETMTKIKISNKQFTINAKLIAASPEMYNALSLMWQAHDDANNKIVNPVLARHKYMEAIRLVRNAILKADGSL